MLILAGGTAWAAPEADIKQIDAKDDNIRVVVSVTGADNADVDTDNVGLTIDGLVVDANTDAVDQSQDFNQVALLVLDTSNSMRGPKIVAAKVAALEFLTALPDEVEVGLVTFSNEAQLVLPPSTERQQLADTINGLQTQPKTVLYDAVVLSASELQDADLGSVVLLSDGADRGSSATLQQASKAAKASGATFDVVNFGESTAQVNELKKIAATTNGTVTAAADAAELSAAFDQSAEAISNQYVITGEIPSEFSGQSATISVSVPVGDVALSDDAFVQFADIQGPLTNEESGPLAVAPSDLSSFTDNLIWIGLVGIFLALLVLFYFAVSSATNREAAGSSGVRRRLSIYTLGGGQPVKEQETTVLGDTQVARSAVEFAGKVVGRRDLESGVAHRLDAAAVPLKPAEWLIIHVGVTIGAGLLFLLIFGGRFIAAVLGMVLGFLGPMLYLSIKESRRIKAFGAGLPNTLQLIAGSLSAGYSMPQAIDTVVREGSPPISTEFNRALIESRLGVPIEDALDGIADRMSSVDFHWVVMAIRIQREVGGNLAEVLTTVAATLRERERLRRQVQVLSAEGRLSAWILGALPIVFATYLVLVRPEYIKPLVTSVFGWLMIGTGIFLLIVGSLWMRKVVKVEV